MKATRVYLPSEKLEEVTYGMYSDKDGLIYLCGFYAIICMSNNRTWTRSNQEDIVATANSLGLFRLAPGTVVKVEQTS